MDVTPSFNECYTNDIFSYQEQIQEYQLISICYASTPADVFRTNIGVEESVFLSLNPPQTNTIWTSTGGYLTATNGSFTTLCAPYGTNITSLTVTATLSGTPVSKQFTVYPPDGTWWSTMEYDFATNFYTNEAGAGMLIGITLGPTNVSFGNVWFEEKGEVATPTGYFANTNVWPAWKLNHANFGANQWVRVSDANSMSDQCSTGTCIPPFSSGTMYLPVPTVWQPNGIDATNSLYFLDSWFFMDQNGTAMVQKYGWYNNRGINGVISTGSTTEDPTPDQGTSPAQ